MKGLTMKFSTITKAIVKGIKLLVAHKILRARYRLLNKQNDMFGITPKRERQHIQICHDLDWSRSKIYVHNAYMKLIIAKWHAENDKK